MFDSRVMTQTEQQLTRMKFYTNSQTTPELLQPALNKTPENSVSPQKPGTLAESWHKNLFTLLSLHSECKPFVGARHGIVCMTYSFFMIKGKAV